jgi:hypothetical protein
MSEASLLGPTDHGGSADPVYFIDKLVFPLNSSKTVCRSWGSSLGSRAGARTGLCVPSREFREILT